MMERDCVEDQPQHALTKLSAFLLWLVLRT